MGDKYWDVTLRVLLGERAGTLWRRHSDAVNRALVASWLPHGRIERILKTDVFDEAAGDGLISLLAAHARRVTGIDLSILALRRARSRHSGLTALGADVCRLPFPDGTFDAVVSNSTLDHFETGDEIVTALEELGRVLRTGGTLIITLDNPLNPVIALRNALPFRLLYRLHILPYYMGATMGHNSLSLELEKAGFRATEKRAVMHCPRLPAVALAGMLERLAAPGIQKRFLEALMAFEHLSHWPTRFLTGCFVAVRATKVTGNSHPQG